MHIRQAAPAAVVVEHGSILSALPGPIRIDGRHRSGMVSSHLFGRGYGHDNAGGQGVAGNRSGFNVLWVWDGAQFLRLHPA
jgi:hypothetical protein